MNSRVEPLRSSPSKAGASLNGAMKTGLLLSPILAPSLPPSPPPTLPPNLGPFAPCPPQIPPAMAPAFASSLTFPLPAELFPFAPPFLPSSIVADLFGANHPMNADETARRDGAELLVHGMFGTGDPLPSQPVSSLTPLSPFSRCTDYSIALGQSEACSNDITNIPYPPPKQPPSLTISLDASLPLSGAESAVQNALSPVQLSTEPAVHCATSPVQLSLLSALPPPSPLLWPPPTMPAAVLPSLMPPSVPAAWSPSYAALIPTSMPPAVSASIEPMPETLPPCWDAWSPKQNMGFATPPTCSGSESEAFFGDSMSDGSLPSAESEADLMIKSKPEDLTNQRRDLNITVPPPPGLEGCLCSFFPAGEKCGCCVMGQKQDCHAAQTAIIQFLGLKAQGLSGTLQHGVHKSLVH